MTKKTIIKLAFLAGTIGVSLLIVFFLVIPNWNEINAVFASRQAFKEWIDSLGWWGPLIYLLVQIAQTVIAPIPGNLTGLVGGAVFGWWWGFVLSYLGTLIGSSLAFYVGRGLGQRPVMKLIGEKRYERYSKVFSGNFSWTLLIIFLVPLFPDDILCILAGLSPLRYRRFIAVVAVGRLPSVVTNNIIGAGLIEANDFNIPTWVWLILGVIVAGLVVVYFFNRTKVKGWLNRKLGLDDEPDEAKNSTDTPETKEAQTEADKPKLTSDV